MTSINYFIVKETEDQNYIDPEKFDRTGSETESAPTATKTEAEKDAASEPADKEIASQNDQSEASLQDRVAQAQSLIAEKRDKEKQDELKVRVIFRQKTLFAS